jgi:anti-anti-sigma regulatory factor
MQVFWLLVAISGPGTMVAIQIEQHSAQACTLIVLKGPIAGTEDSKPLREAILRKLVQAQSPILVDFSQVTEVDNYGLFSLLAVSFLAGHNKRTFGIFGANPTVSSWFASQDAEPLLLKAETRRDAYKELCGRKGDDGPPFDILQFVREEVGDRKEGTA